MKDLRAATKTLKEGMKEGLRAAGEGVRLQYLYFGTLYIYSFFWTFFFFFLNVDFSFYF